MAEHDGIDPRKQAEVLRALAGRLEEGEPSLPTDVFGQIVREIEHRADEAIIAAAWDEQGGKEPEPWVFLRGRAQG